jgi:hypothetical protein
MPRPLGATAAATTSMSGADPVSPTGSRTEGGSGALVVVLAGAGVLVVAPAGDNEHPPRAIAAATTTSVAASTLAAVARRSLRDRSSGLRLRCRFMERPLERWGNAQRKPQHCRQKSSRGPCSKWRPASHSVHRQLGLILKATSRSPPSSCMTGACLPRRLNALRHQP